MNLADLRLRLRALLSPRTIDRELDEELTFHVECETRKLMAGGAGAAEARRRALGRFGPVPLVADRCRDERGIAGFETLARDIGFALRALRRVPLLTLTVVSTIGLGLGVVTVAFTFFNAFFLRVNAVRDPDELFALVRLTGPGGHHEIPFTALEYEALRRDTDVFADVAAARPSVSTRIDGRAARGTFVSGNFFELLGVTAARGRTLTRADHDGGGRAVVVLSHLGWEKLFSADPAVVGRQLMLNGHPFEVTGVMPRDFRGLTQEPQDYWAPLALVGQVRGGSSAPTSVDVLVRLKGTTPGAAAAAVSAWASAQPGAVGPGQDAVRIDLEESRGVISKDRGEAMAAFMPILFAFGLILTIGCANVANLLLARGLSRHREIGVRLSLGATRGRIVRQLLTESLVLALAAAPLGLLVSRALLAGSIHVALSILPPEFAESMDVVIPPADWRVLAFLLGGALLATFTFGLVPALHSTRLDLVRAMRGEVTRNARPGRVRQLLIGSQVTASAALLVCAAVFLRGTVSTATADVGVRVDDTLVVGGITESARGALLHAVRQHPSVRSVAASWPDPTVSGPPVEATAGTMSWGVGCKFVSPEYFDLLGITPLRGRVFGPRERSPEAGVVVVSDAVARRFWPNGGALGQTLRLGGTAFRTNPDGSLAPPQSFVVIGVVRDVRSALRAVNVSYSGVYLPATPEQANTSLVLRVHGDPDSTRLVLLNDLVKADPALGQIMTMRMVARLDSAVLAVMFWMAVILGALALALTVSGLFGVLSYLVEQRRRELGVRMALGAAPRDIVRLVLRQSMRPVAFGAIAGGALAAAVAVVLLWSPLAEMVGTFVHPFDPLAYAAGLATIAATCLLAALLPAWRAARIDPVATLRAE